MARLLLKNIVLTFSFLAVAVCAQAAVGDKPEARNMKLVGYSDL